MGEDLNVEGRPLALRLLTPIEKAAGKAPSPQQGGGWQGWLPTVASLSYTFTPTK